ncbi:hypothetical protein [Streptosporangium subroseum]|uniref:hypothetical protein n=1 Tax=Streptosporangium subroseum TaxID=106412 RepID=UPI00308B90FE|nr:hypothetical protein OHB15_18575 [Streptosporangium subroseum]
MTANFTILSNATLQCRSLSILARGLLAYLLSLSSGTPQSIEALAAESYEGKTAIARAQRELIAAGYIRVVRTRGERGRFVTEVHVYDTPQTSENSASPQVAPNAANPAVGGPVVGQPTAGKTAPKRKEATPEVPTTKETTPLPTLPAVTVPERREAGEIREAVKSATPFRGGRDSSINKEKSHLGGAFVAPRGRGGDFDDEDNPDDDGNGSSVADLLARIAAKESRLTVEQREAGKVILLVREWRRRGVNDAQIIEVVTSGLPEEIKSAAGLMANRLARHMPPIRHTIAKPKAVFVAECDECARPVTAAGLCSLCVPESAVPALADNAGPARVHGHECIECDRPVKISGKCGACAPKAARAVQSAYAVGDAGKGAALARELLARRAVAAETLPS